MPLFEVIVRKDVEETWQIEADNMEDARANWYEGDPIDLDIWDETIERVALLDDLGNPIEPELPF